ncbi:hypothetical protein SERLA73DRAFT_44154, partial [Serpula lacrymans var. lacrymans S7.3]
DIICIANIQHNCINSNCATLRETQVQQERIETTCTKSVTQHQPTNIYILNTYSIHNYHHIQSVIPDPLRNVEHTAGSNKHFRNLCHGCTAD